MSFRKLALKAFIENIVSAYDQTLQAAYTAHNNIQGNDLPFTIMPAVNFPTSEIILAVFPYRMNHEDEPDKSDQDPKMAAFLKEQLYFLLDKTLLERDIHLAQVEEEPGTMAIATANPTKLVSLLEDLVTHHNLQCHDNLPKNQKPKQSYYTHEDVMDRFNTMGIANRQKVLMEQIFMQPATIYCTAASAFFDAEINREKAKKKTVTKILPFSFQRLHALAKDAGGVRDVISLPSSPETDEPAYTYQTPNPYAGLHLTH
ncbi:MAG TPA: hypothetical protein PKI93_00490 [Alphaproteobacteria bacterium]|nr:hypothetical protein [Alphaproteobacteria bacterium]HNS44708.1 hypothetical protein [Alphaproteobacteria bacterium]